jgi:lysophospholipase L1-like esterase
MTSVSVCRRRLTFFLAFVALTAGVTWAGAMPVQAQAAPIRIMPTGDSITEGASGDATYRYFLWQSLLNAGNSVDFVGSKTGVSSGTPKYPNFDQNHEGHSGWRADRMANSATSWATSSAAQIVLLHAGTNDLIQGQTVASTIIDLTNIIKRMRTANPQMTFLMAKIIPIAGMTSLVQQLNTAIGTLATQMNTATSRVVAVDLYTGFSVTTDLKADGIHPTESGYQKMANNWAAAVAPFLTSTPPPPPPPPPTGGALFVVGTPAAMSAADTAILNRLTGLGLTVTVADDDSVQASAATGKSVVLISASVLPDKIGNKFAGTAVPLVTWEGGLYDDLGMTGSVLGTDLGESVSKKKITILLPSHPIAAGRSGTIIAVDPGAKLMWGRPSASGIIVAHVGDFPALPAVFAYEAGASMVVGSAPARRVGLFLNATTAPTLTVDGWAIFDAAVNWARA